MPLMHCVYYSEKRNVFSDRQKTAAVHDGSCKFLGSEFQNIGPATKKAWWPYAVSWWDGITSWRPAAEHIYVVQRQLSRLEHNTQLAEPYRHRRVITPSLYFQSSTLGYIKPVELSMHQLPQTTIELPCTTDYTSCRVATCWWWSLEPQRRQRYSSRRGTSRRRARASWQTPKSVSAGCAVVDVDGGSRSRWRWKHASRGWGQPKKSPQALFTCWLGATTAPPSCSDGKLPSPIERERLVPAQSSSVLSMLSFSRLADIQ